jgi:beta-aspartyl-peptidase (threonine type)
MSKDYSLAIHGGGIWADAMRGTENDYLESMGKILAIGKGMAENGAEAVDIAVALTVLLEDDPLYKAGRGSVSKKGQAVTMDAAVVDGKAHTYGAVTTLRNVKNPVMLAKHVMQNRTESMIVGPGAEVVAKEVGLSFEPDEYFCVEPRPGPKEMGTVGVTVRDIRGNMAAAASTGGFPGQTVSEWRVGDTPIVGAGVLADNRSCAISTCGHGEKFVGAGVTRRIAGRVEFVKQSMQDAIDAGLKDFAIDYVEPAVGGVIGVDSKGAIGRGVTASFCMACGWIEHGGSVETRLFKADAL